MELGMVDAMRLANDSTKGSPATMRLLWLADAVWDLMTARYRNGGTNCRVYVPDGVTFIVTKSVNY
jgi:hypothetical protein